MTETLITVRGDYSARFPAERATAAVAVSTDGADRAAVFAQATDAAETVRASIAALHNGDDGPVTWWSSDAVSISNYRPWSPEGKQLDIVYTAAIGFRATFNDFAALALWVDHIATVAGVSVSGIDWALTEATREAATADVRRRAVADAVAKATTFAEAISLSTVTAIAIADPGMLGNASSAGGGDIEPRMMSKASMDAGSASMGLSLRPEEIEVSSAVDVRFSAR
jgi:uncharacterized protein